MSAKLGPFKGRPAAARRNPTLAETMTKPAKAPSQGCRGLCVARRPRALALLDQICFLLVHEIWREMCACVDRGLLAVCRSGGLIPSTTLSRADPNRLQAVRLASLPLIIAEPFLFKCPPVPLWSGRKRFCGCACSAKSECCAMSRTFLIVVQRVCGALAPDTRARN